MCILSVKQLKLKVLGNLFDCSMEAKKDEQSSATVGRKRDIGYRYMMPSYAVDEELDPATSYRVIADALLENSSAHGFPTLYRARGLNPFSSDSFSVIRGTDNDH